MTHAERNKRNDRLYALHILDPKKYSVSHLAREEMMSRQAMSEILLREAAKRGDKDAKKSATVRAKYPNLVRSRAN